MALKSSRSSCTGGHQERGRRERSPDFPRRAHALGASELDARAAGSVGERDLHELRPHFLAEAELLARLDVAAAALAGDPHRELVLADGHIAGVDPLHASLAEGLQLLPRVHVARCRLAVDVDLDRVELEVIVRVQRNEDGHLGIRREEQRLLELRQLRRDGEDVRLDLLDLLVQAPHLRLGTFLRRHGARGKEEEQ